MFLVIILVITLSHGIWLGNALHFQELEVFQDSNAEDLIYRGPVSEECKPLPPLSLGVFFYSSNCTMIYHSLDCSSFSHKLQPGVMSKFTAWMQQKPLGYFKMSYKLCDATEKTESITVTFHGEDKLRPLVEYTDVCECVNVPNSIADSRIMSLNNHGKCLLLFAANRCAGLSTRVEGGKNFLSENLDLYIELRSFRPCNIPPHCFSFSASAIRFELHSSIRDQNLEKVTLSAFETFINNGTGNLERTYTVKETFTESFQFTNTNALSKLSSVTVDSSLKAEVGAEMSASVGITEAKVKTSISASMAQALGSSETFTNSNGNIVSISKSKEYERSEKIVVPACTESEVSSYVNVLKDVPSNYVVYFRVKGVQRRKVLNTAQIRKHFSANGMMYLHDENEVEAVYRWSGTLTATMGFQAMVTVNERKIESCENPKDASPIANPEKSMEDTTGESLNLTSVNNSKNVTHTRPPIIDLNNSVEEVTMTSLESSPILPSNLTIQYAPCDNATYTQLLLGVLLGIVGTILSAIFFVMICCCFVDLQTIGMKYKRESS